MRDDGRAFELLREANPVPAAALEGLAVPAETIRPPLGEDASPRRRRMSPARVLLAVLALVVAFVLVAPALGLELPVLDFWKAAKAPARVVEDFESLTAGAPPGMDPGAIAGEARKVTTVDGPHTLWVAPTKAGGFCLTWTNGSGGCDKLGTVPLGVTWSAAGSLPVGSGGRPEVSMEHFTRISGHVNAAYAESVELRFANGDVVHPDVTWVSEPIGAGFFFYEIPKERRQPGREITAVVALDGDGQTVAEETGRPSESTDNPPVEAVVGERAAVARVGTRAGEAVVWTAPTRYEGLCAWLELGGRSLAFVPCMPKGYPFGAFAYRFVPTQSTVLLVGWVKDDVAIVEIGFADGGRLVVHPQNGFVLAEVPVEHQVRGREATTITSRDIFGKALHPPFEVGDLGGARFACLAPLPLEREQSGPFCL